MEAGSARCTPLPPKVSSFLFWLATAAVFVYTVVPLGYTLVDQNPFKPNQTKPSQANPNHLHLAQTSVAAFLSLVPILHAVVLLA